MAPDAHPHAPSLVRAMIVATWQGVSGVAAACLVARPAAVQAPGSFGRCSASTFELRKCGGQWVASAVYAYRRLLAAQQFHRLEESRDGPPQRASVRGTKCPTDFALANMFTSAAAVLTFIFARI